MLTELVTNAVEHARTTHTVTVSLLAADANRIGSLLWSSSLFAGTSVPETLPQPGGTTTMATWADAGGADATAIPAARRNEAAASWAGRRLRNGVRIGPMADHRRQRRRGSSGSSGAA